MFRRVIIGVDGLPNSRDAIALGLRLVDYDGTACLAHVSTSDKTAALDFLRDEYSAAAANCELLSIPGRSPAAGLHRLASEQVADLLVLGSCHRGRSGRILTGDDVQATLTGAPCPVAVAPAGYAGSDHPLNTIGVAYDGSVEARIALAAARDLGAREDAGVQALQVIEPPTSQPMFVDAPELWGKTASAELEGARRALDLPPEVMGQVVMGSVDDQLAAFGARVDLLVLGARDLGRFGRALHRSASRHLARHCKSPVLVISHPVEGPDPASVAETTSASGSAPSA